MVDSNLYLHRTSLQDKTPVITPLDDCVKKDNRFWNSSKEEIDRIHPGVLVIIDSESDLHPSYFSHVVFVMSQLTHQLYMILVSYI